jgi:hypothetical protein
VRFGFEAIDHIHFPPGKAANLLRGALGLVLDPRLFAPARASGPSGLADPPRPFVLRARNLDGVTVPPGAGFHFDLHLFADELASFRQALEQVFREGIGPGRGRAEPRETSAEPVSIDLGAAPASAHWVRSEFVSPTELKREGRPVERPEFAILFARIRDRISTLRALYGPGPLEIDFAAMGARAALVRMTACQLHHVGVVRKSSRTGQVHPIGGFTGYAEYEGDLGEFLPYLEAAHWTGIGRQAVWGKGEIYTQSRG